MIQLQAITNILDNNNLTQYNKAGVTISHFSDYNDEYKYITDHYKKYNKVPDKATFYSIFPDFDQVNVKEPTEYIINNLKEEYLFTKSVKLFKESSEVLEQNSYDGLRKIVTGAQTLLRENMIGSGIDANSSEMREHKLQQIEYRKKLKGLIGISTGFRELDDVLNGWFMGDELVTIVGRVNQGKSWLLLKFLAEANKQYKKVLLYSGEMGAVQVSMRLDTLLMNYSNRELNNGTISDEDLISYSSKLEKRDYPECRIITPLDLGGKQLTISMLDSLIETYKPDIVGIDQISLMDDERRMKGDQTRTQYTHIAQDLYALSVKHQIPILADAQANRNKADVKNPENPELADIGESDGIAQNSSRVISLVQTENGLSLKVTKNRYGQNNKTFIYTWDIDLGTFIFSTNQDTDISDTTLPTRNSSANKSFEDIF